MRPQEYHVGTATALKLNDTTGGNGLLHPCEYALSKQKHTPKQLLALYKPCMTPCVSCFY